MTDSKGNRVGPHPSFIKVAQPYIFEDDIQKSISATGVSPSKEDSIRLLGVAWIDNVRRALQLYVFYENYLYTLITYIPSGMSAQSKLSLLPWSTITSSA